MLLLFFFFSYLYLFFFFFFFFLQSSNSADRNMALAAIMYSLPHAHYAVIKRLVNTIVVCCDGNSKLEKECAAFLAPVVFEPGSMLGAQVLELLITSREHCFNLKLQFGLWEPDGISHALKVAPLPVMVQIVTNSEFQKVDPDFCLGFLANHHYFTSSEQLMRSFCQMYKMNRGSKMSPSRRAKLQALCWIVRQWILSEYSQECVYIPLFVRFAKQMTPHVSQVGSSNVFVKLDDVEALHDFEGEFLDFLVHFKRIYSPQSVVLKGKAPEGW
jgi:hypothetical protein